MLEGEEAVPLVRDMQERIAVRFAAWASAMAGSGRSEELRTALASVLGEERARIAAALVVPSARSGRTFRRPAKGRWTRTRTGCCEAGAISAADLREVQEVVHTRGGVA